MACFRISASCSLKSLAYVRCIIFTLIAGAFLEHLRRPSSCGLSANLGQLVRRIQSGFSLLKSFSLSLGVLIFHKRTKSVCGICCALFACAGVAVAVINQRFPMATFVYVCFHDLHSRMMLGGTHVSHLWMSAVSKPMVLCINMVLIRVFQAEGAVRVRSC